MTRFGVIRFPGSCDEVDAALACEKVGEAEILWHGDRDLKGVDAVVVPGGFSYGDYLRVGAIARFSPVMESVIAFAREGGTVLGICNGFQVLCEAGLLPGALLRNQSLRFLCRQVEVEVVSADTAWTNACEQGQILSIPTKHGEGRFYAPDDMLDRLGHQLDLAADEAQSVVGQQRARQQPRLAEDLEPVADAQHRPPLGGEAANRLHRGREAGDRAGAEIVAIGEPAGDDDRVDSAQIPLLVPDEARVADPLAGLQRVALVTGARELEHANHSASSTTS